MTEPDGIAARSIGEALSHLFFNDFDLEALALKVRKN
jgi:hypothetical protein